MSVSVMHVLGARPNFPKAAPVIDALTERGVSQFIVHTGQHYDDVMSGVFFRQLNLPLPDRNLKVGSDTHARQTAAIMVGLEAVFEEIRPSMVVVYGDVNSTLAASLVAAKLGISVAHVEAGLRSFDRSMPEEVNRIVTDQVSSVLFATSADAVEHLLREGVDAERVHLVGNSMIDTVLANLSSLSDGKVRDDLGLGSPYAVATLHRPGNVDNSRDALAMVRAVHGVADLIPVVLPLHPRGRERFAAVGLLDHGAVRVVEPLGYLEFLSLVHGARVVITDSGGVQEEATVLGVPCLTVRPNTERPVTISHGTNRLVKRDELVSAVAQVLQRSDRESWPVPPLWDGKSGARIADVLVRLL